MQTKAVGGVMLCQSPKLALAWLKRALKDSDIELHGPRYVHRFYLLEASEHCAAIFYSIEGYQTEEEGIAFSHATFVLDGFLDTLEARAGKMQFFAFADVGTTIEQGEWVGFEEFNMGLIHFKQTLESLRDLAIIAKQKGKLVWENGFFCG